jgi:membrane protease YdiL (CAAX protease family)
MRKKLDRPTLRDYGVSDENLKDNSILAAKLIFIIFAIESIVVLFFQYVGVSFEGGPEKIDILFIFSAVIVAPIFEEAVYRMNASTLLVNRLPIFWVAWITSTWFIIKHFPMWFFDDNFGLPALIILIIIDIPIWVIVTYFYLTKRSIWIPFLVHFFNNASIALFFHLPDHIANIIGFSFVIVGMIFLIVFGIPWLYKSILKPLFKCKIKINKRTQRNLKISLLLIFLFLVTSEALVSLSIISELICIPIGFLFLILTIITFVYVFIQGEDIFVNNKNKF